MSGRFDVRIDVSDAIRLDASFEVAASIYPGQRHEDEHDRHVLLFAAPGGTYSRAYFDFHAPGRRGYSFAERMADAGITVVAFDYIGLGESTPYEPFNALTKDVVLAGVHATIERVSDGLATGTIVDGLAPITDPFKVGVGHSMGGYFLVLQQARARSFDALAILGWSQLLRWDPNSDTATQLRADLASGMDPTVRNASWTTFFYDRGVPEDVIAYDAAIATRIFSWVLQPERSGLLDDPENGEAARAISVPLFLGFGEVDLSPDTHAEPSAYPNSPDLTLYVLPRSGHCLNLAETRGQFFDRLAEWTRSVVCV